MDAFLQWIEGSLSLNTFLQWRLIATAGVILTLVLARWLIMTVVSRRTADAAVLYRWRKVVGYTTLLIGLFALGRIWLVGGQSFATYLGLLSAGLAVALKDPISNIFGWLFIIGRRPFEVGDRIEINGQAGDVVDIRIFQFSVLEIGNWVQADQSTGRVLHIPNQKVFTDSVANFHQGIAYIWHEIPVVLTFESDWRKGKAILEEIVEESSGVMADTARESLRKAARRYMISYDKLTPIVYMDVVDHGVRLTARYLCDPRRRRSIGQVIWEKMLEALEREPDLDLAYPTQRIFYNPQEGDPALQRDREDAEGRTELPE